MKSLMEKQMELIKMILNKMKIKTEEGDQQFSEPGSPSSLTSSTRSLRERQDSLAINVSNNRLKSLVIKQIMSRADSSFDDSFFFS